MSSPQGNESEFSETAPSLASITTESTNPWDVDPGNSRWAVMSAWYGMNDFRQKIGLIEEESKDGHCYLWLALYVERISCLEFPKFEEFIKEYKKTCLARPYSETAFADLMVMCMTDVFPDGTNLSGRALSSELINHMMCSPVRMKIEGGEVLHIEPQDPLFLGCGCSKSEIYCDHGLAARYIITVLSASKKRLGATLNFDDIEFDDEFEESQTHLSNQTPTPKPLNIHMPLSDNKVNLSGTTLDPSQFPNAPHKPMEARVGEVRTSGPRRRPGFKREKNFLLDDRIDEIDALGRLSSVVSMASAAAKESKRNNSTYDKKYSELRYQRAVRGVIEEMKELGLDVESDGEGDLDPDDSSSNFGVRKQRAGTYMKTGTVLSQDPERGLRRSNTDSILTGTSNATTRRTATEVGPLVKSGNAVVRSMVKGFQKTEEMIREEIEVVSSIKEINGLADPLKSDRLMLLMHIHTGLGSRHITADDPDSIFSGLTKLMSSKGRTASERLLLTVVESTFDNERLCVTSNAFKLPYIEVGMKVSGGMLVKCFDQLRMEYEILWFDQFKGLKVPDFHSKFAKLSEGDPSTRKGNNSVWESKHSSKHEKKRRSSSILSFK